MGKSGLGLGLLCSFFVFAACSSDDAAPGDGGTPVVASCANGVIDPGELGIDCGGTCKSCDGAGCTDGTQCSSGSCTGGKCDPPPTKTCGVGLPKTCGDGEACAQDLDCGSDYCDGSCKPPPDAAHADQRRNAGETGVDCGGAAPADCPVGERCKTSDDCLGLCNASGTCDAPSATDQKKNNDETDVDCGGPNAPKCAVDKACNGNTDCELLACTANKCVVPTETDGVQNGGESDIDCGGPGVMGGGVTYTPPRCKEGKTCAADGDCATGACSPANKCVVKSCDTAETAGITTCGAGEVGEAGAAHESCCKSLKLPTVNKRLDKYEITAGRFRSFLTAVGPNVRQWVATFIAANPTHQLATMMSSYPVLKDLYPATKTGPLSLVAYMSIDVDNYNGVRGCYNGAGNYGANTYWMDKADLAEYGIPERPQLRTVTDAKSLNCAPPLMFAAFCAWDGGELPMFSDLIDSWGPNTYPWGANDIGRPNYNWCNGYDGTGGFHCQNAAIGDAGLFYEFPKNVDWSLDFSPLIAGPGRFTMDASQLKVGADSWMDLYANLVEYTGDFQGTTTDFCDFSGEPAAGATTCTRTNRDGSGTKYVGVPVTRVIGRSWEGHVYERTNTNKYSVLFQYGKFGARCARPVE